MRIQYDACKESLRNSCLDEWAAGDTFVGISAGANLDASKALAITRRYPFTGAEPVVDDIFQPGSPTPHMDPADQQPPSPVFASAHIDEPREIGRAHV